MSEQRLFGRYDMWCAYRRGFLEGRRSGEEKPDIHPEAAIAYAEASANAYLKPRVQQRTARTGEGSEE